MMGRGKAAASLRDSVSSFLQACFDEVWITITAIGIIASSCRTTKTTTLTATTTRDSVRSDLHFFVKNTIIKDSTYVRERGDTVFVDRWHTEVRDSVIKEYDTTKIVIRDSIPYPVEVPVEVEKPLPKWVKNSIAALIIENIIIAAVIVIRLRTRKTLRRLTIV